MFCTVTCNTPVHTLTQTTTTVPYRNLIPSLFTVCVPLWVGGLRQVKPVVQIPLLFSAWLDCNFLSFGKQDMLPCTQENSSNVHLVAARGQEIKDTHMHMSHLHWQHHQLLPVQTNLLPPNYTWEKFFHDTRSHTITLINVPMACSLSFFKYYCVVNCLQCKCQVYTLQYYHFNNMSLT